MKGLRVRTLQDALDACFLNGLFVVFVLVLMCQPWHQALDDISVPIADRSGSLPSATVSDLSTKAASVVMPLTPHKFLSSFLAVLESSYSKKPRQAS